MCMVLIAALAMIWNLLGAYVMKRPPTEAAYYPAMSQMAAAPVAVKTIDIATAAAMILTYSQIDNS